MPVSDIDGRRQKIVAVGQKVTAFGSEVHLRPCDPIHSVTVIPLGVFRPAPAPPDYRCAATHVMYADESSDSRRKQGEGHVEGMSLG